MRCGQGVRPTADADKGAAVRCAQIPWLAGYALRVRCTGCADDVGGHDLPAVFGVRRGQPSRAHRGVGPRHGTRTLREAGRETGARGPDVREHCYAP
jgi:hypothetical protein